MITNDDREDKLWMESDPPSGMIYGDETEKERKKRIKRYKTKKLLEEQYENLQ